MRRRHLLLGMSAVLVLSVAIPAFGSQVFRASGKNSAVVARQALKAARQALAEAEAIAARVKGGKALVDKARATVADASSAAGGAKVAARSALQTANGALQVAGGAQQAADRARLDAESGKSQAANALQVANSKFGRAERVAGSGFSPGGQVVHASVSCNGKGRLSNGGYRLTTRPDSEVFESEPSANEWDVEAFADDGGFGNLIEVIALCVAP